MEVEVEEGQKEQHGKHGDRVVVQSADRWNACQVSGNDLAEVEAARVTCHRQHGGFQGFQHEGSGWAVI
jgi:ribonuclease HI